MWEVEGAVIVLKKCSLVEKGSNPHPFLTRSPFMAWERDRHAAHRGRIGRRLAGGRGGWLAEWGVRCLWGPWGLRGLSVLGLGRSAGLAGLGVSGLCGARGGGGLA